MPGQELTLSLIVTAALADSINPCVLGVLIFLVAFLNKTFQSKRRMLLGGFFYTAVVYATYLALGFGIVEATVNFEISRAFYWLAAAVAIIAGLLEVKDYFWYGKGFTLQMIPGGAQRIKYYTSKIETLQTTHPVLGFLLIGFIGFLVVLIELPCTGAPYLAILALIAEGSYAQATPLLLLYNFVFVVPLLVVIALSYFGRSSERMEMWRKKNRGLMRLGIGIFLLALGAYMIYSLVGV